MGFFSDSSFSYVNIQCIIEMRLFFLLAWISSREDGNC